MYAFFLLIFHINVLLVNHMVVSAGMICDGWFVHSGCRLLSLRSCCWCCWLCIYFISVLFNSCLQLQPSFYNISHVTTYCMLYTIPHLFSLPILSLGWTMMATWQWWCCTSCLFYWIVLPSRPCPLTPGIFPLVLALLLLWIPTTSFHNVSAWNMFMIAVVVIRSVSTMMSWMGNSDVVLKLGFRPQRHIPSVRISGFCSISSW